MTTRPPENRPAGKAKSGRQAAARQQASATRAAQQARARRRRLLLGVGLPVLLVVLIVVGLVVVKANTKSTPAAALPPAGATGPAATGPAATGPAAASAGASAAASAKALAQTSAKASAQASANAVQRALATIPAATFDAVGAGTNVRAPLAVTGAPLAADGKPRVLYVGAEYCPYCAGERWAVVAALSRFGTFSNLGTTSSARAPEVYPSTATLSFHGATYTSSLLSFTGLEVASNIPNANGKGYTALDTLTDADQQINTTYNPNGSIPFVDFGNRYVVVVASYDVGLLQGLTQPQIAAQMADPTTALAKGVDGAANMMTAALCAMTNGQPVAVCSSPAVTSATLP